MPAHMSNADRIARKAAEAEAKLKEKAEKAAAKALLPKVKRVSKPREPKPPQRMKIVWGVGEPGGVSSKIYPYAEKAAADAEAARLGKGHIVKALKVPME